MIKQMAILTDVTKCIGCEACVTACKKINDLPEDKPWRWQKNATDLSASRWTTILHSSENSYVRKQCRHCVDPACASVCPVGALKKTESGAVIYDGAICMGCRYCMMACPYGIPRYSWNEPVPYVRKCIMCQPSIASGKITEPACTSACPENATIFGEREELLEEARRRIEEKPDLYVHRIWGEKEVGGTNVLYISNVDLGFLGWKPDLGNESLPMKTWPALKIVPGVFLGVGAVMGVSSWFIKRRMKVMEAEALASESVAAEKGELLTNDGDTENGAESK